MKQIYIIGIGMGNTDTLTLGGLARIEGSKGLVGAERMIAPFDYVDAEKHAAISPARILEWIKEHEDLNPVSVLMSGDVGFFSGARKLAELIEQDTEYEVELAPGISSLQYFCGRLKTAWDDVKIVSLHGRDANFIGEIRTHEKTFLLTDSQKTPDYICARLSEAGLGDVDVAVGETLSYTGERITRGTAAQLQGKSFDPLSVVLVRNPGAAADEDRPVTHGISDEAFIRGKVPMTKEEVRSVTLSKLRLRQGDVIYDVGAGTGSVSIEMALQARKGQVFAIETKPEAVSLIRENKRVFGADNLYIIEGMAPDAMKELPAPDKAFIGGSGGNMREIVTRLVEKNPQVRIVVNVIALESVGEALETFSACGLSDMEIVQVSAAKAKELGGYHMMTGQNPVFVIAGQRKRDEQCAR